MTFPYAMFALSSPYVVVYGGEVEDKSSSFFFGYFWESACQTGKRIDRIFFCAIFHIRIELDSIERVMSEDYISTSIWYILL